jgi:DNA-3-methyladenine glycosylase
MVLLKRSFYERATPLVAEELLGKIMVRTLADGTLLKGRIVETEAYLGIDDRASHAYGGMRVRNAPLFGTVGYTYVYFIYGMYYCLNFVARAPQASAGGVLIRAVEPLNGIEFMQHGRSGLNLQALTNGPGKLTKAFSINRADDGLDVTKKAALYVLDGSLNLGETIVTTTRIGISKAAHETWRFYIKDNLFVSRR